MVEFNPELKASKLLQEKCRAHPQFEIHTNTQVKEFVTNVLLDDFPELLGYLAALPAHPFRDRAGCALAQLVSVDVDTRHPRRGGEGDPFGLGQLAGRAGAEPEVLLGEHDDRAPFRRFVGETGQLRGIGELRR